MPGAGVTHSVRPVFHDRTSIRPGQRGSTLLAGHSFSKGNGVFDKLWQLKPGNLVRYFHRGKVVVFKVKKLMRVRPNASTDGCYDLRGRPRVCLYTCDERTRTPDGIYHGKIIALAVKVRSQKPS